MVSGMKPAMNQKILLVDDSQEMRSLIKCLLQPEGYEIVEAGNGQEALDILGKDSPPNLILLDHNMPVMDGPKFLIVIEKKYPLIFAKVPIVLLTATASHEMPITSAAEVISKPVKLDTLLSLVAKYLH